jgi:hypothetical protein
LWGAQPLPAWAVDQQLVELPQARSVPPLTGLLMFRGEVLHFADPAKG